MFMMRVLLKLLIGLLMGLFLATGVARAENWYQLAETKNGKHSIDLDSIRLVEGRVRYWVKTDYASTQYKSWATYIETRDSWIGDCRERISAVSGAVYYDAQGQVVKTFSFRDRLDFSDVMPGTVGEVQLNFACARAEALGLPVGPKSTALSSAPPGASAAEKTSSIGSGFVVDKQGTVVTNQHVVDDCGRIEVRHQGQTYPAKLVKADKNIDLAILRIKPGLPTATLRREPVEVGQSVFVAGFPLAGLLSSDMNFTPGMVSSLAGLRGDITELQITAPVQPGNSGGPLLDEAGQVSGVVVSKLDALVIAEKIGDIPQNVNFAIKTDMLRLFLDSNRIVFEATTAIPRDPVQIANKARGFTVQVVCD